MNKAEAQDAHEKEGQPITMTLAEINAFLKKQQADKETEQAEADKEAEEKPKRGRTKAQEAE